MKPHIRMSRKTKNLLIYMYSRTGWERWYRRWFTRMHMAGYPVKVRRGVDGLETVNLDERAVELLESRLVRIGINVTRRCV